MFDVDVVVVGAGKTTIVLEARDRVAGRNMGGFLSNGVPVEMGGQWVGPTQDVVLELIKELGLETFPSFDQGEALTVFDDNIVRYADKTYGLPPESAFEVGRLWEQLEALAATVAIEEPWDTVAIEEPWDTEGAQELDRQTLDSLIRTGFGSASFGRMNHAPSISAGVPATCAQDARGGNP